ncbi:hypothetical protein ACROYT_G040288 [Oculina patagonica]
MFTEDREHEENVIEEDINAVLEAINLPPKGSESDSDSDSALRSDTDDFAFYGVVSIPPHAVRTYLVSRDIALNQFYPTRGVFTDCLTFGDEDCGFQRKKPRPEKKKIVEIPWIFGRVWKEWIEEITYFEITEIKDRVSALKIYGGKEIKKLARNLPETTPVVGDNDYKKLKRKLDNYFLPKKNKHHGRFTFSKQKPVEGASVVTYCGKTGTHTPGRNCPAYGKQCLKCGKYNHYASCCTTGAQPQERRGQIKKTTEAEETSSGSDDDYIYLQETAQHLHRVKKIRSGQNQETVLIDIGDIEPDSGASANVMDEYQFKALKHRSQEIKNLEPSRDTLKTLQSNLTVKGEFTATLRNKNQGAQSKFLVIQGKIDSPPLLSKSTLLELGMLKIDPEGTLKETNELRIKTAKTQDDNIEAVLDEYSNVFQGIGCFREKSTGKKIEVKLEMEPDAEPVAQKPRPVPYHLQKPLNDWLDQGVKEEIFEKVPDGEAITWCSSLVVQPKPKFTDEKNEELESHMIRASIDMRIPN